MSEKEKTADRGTPEDMDLRDSQNLLDEETVELVLHSFEQIRGARGRSSSSVSTRCSLEGTHFLFLGSASFPPTPFLDRGFHVKVDSAADQLGHAGSLIYSLML